jgi:hypothetical protein
MSQTLANYRMPIGLFRFRIVPVNALLVPRFNKGNMLRGGFGHAFRHLCCVPQCKDTKNCPVATSCPYKQVFEPSPPPHADRLSKNQDIPRPFVFRAPLNNQTQFESGQAFEFGLVLIGRALDFLPYFVLSFREVAAEGVGLNRAKCNLERVEQIEACPNGAELQDYRSAVIYTSESQLFRAAKLLSGDDWIKSRLHNISDPKGNGTLQRITIRFLTPTFLRADGEVIHRPEFHQVFKRLRDRINALSTFFGSGPLDVDFQELGRSAENVRTVACDVKWIERFRTSSKTRQRHELSGLIGDVSYEGDLREFLPWLALGELTHLGKHTAWGMGWYEMTSIHLSV